MIHFQEISRKEGRYDIRKDGPKITQCEAISDKANNVQSKSNCFIYLDISIFPM